MKNLLKKLFGSQAPKKQEDSFEQRRIEFLEKKDKERKIFELAFEQFYKVGCQCTFPRYRQILSIDCSSKGDSYKCYDTELLIEMSKPYFDIQGSELKDEITNKKWVCKTCKSVFEYGLSDFSIALDRQKVKLIELNTKDLGKPVKLPIPIFLGLHGHSYPSKNKIMSAALKDVEEFILEK